MNASGSMTDLVFYAKPGCVGNLRQQKELRSQGVSFVVRDLISEPWSEQQLRPFFCDKPVVEWFNTTAPRVKSGELAIDELSEVDALALMIDDPILIRRPLLALGEQRQSGFEAGPVLQALGVVLDATENLQECPMQDEATVTCEGP
ncbi:MAG: ArsC/Spx/MgsR family protein [Candidatus Thiodiazotropha sp.]